MIDFDLMRYIFSESIFKIFTLFIMLLIPIQMFLYFIFNKILK